MKNYYKNVYIEKTPNADTRFIEVLDKDLVYKDTLNHIKGVQKVMEEFGKAIYLQSTNHDYSKIGTYYDGFFEAISSGKKGKDFFELDWWKIHRKERHHLNDWCPDDVDLIDVIEMLCDCVSAGMARSGSVFPVKLSNDILQKAVLNTVEMLKDKVKVK